LSLHLLPILPHRFHGSKEERQEIVDNQLKPARSMAERDWDVVITTYEVVNLERSALTKIAWNYLIIDEAHRLKNEASQFSTTVRMLNTKHRLLLTGTPLQNNLHELWALLNFLLPDIFASAEQVQIFIFCCYSCSVSLFVSFLDFSEFPGISVRPTSNGNFPC
jgi:SNF2 family DNA or RNA helicase